MSERLAPECGCTTEGKIVRGMCAMHYDRWVHKTPKDRRPPPPSKTRRRLAHRVSLNESAPCPDESLLACHRCDNPPCVNPTHLYWGTHADNARDMVERGGTYNKGVYAEVCKRGHRIEGDNLRIVGQIRKRMCRECDNKRKRESAQRQREAARGAR